MNRIGDIINCAWEGCDKKCKRKTSKHKYCKQHRIAAKQKRTEESNAKRRREKGFPEVGDIVKCAVEECENMFLYAFRRRYCYDCAAKRRRETTKKYLIKLRENPDEYERVHLKMRRRWATYWRNNKGGSSQ